MIVAFDSQEEAKTILHLIARGCAHVGAELTQGRDIAAEASQILAAAHNFTVRVKGAITIAAASEAAKLDGVNAPKSD